MSDSDADSVRYGLLENFLNPCQGIPLLIRRILLTNPAPSQKFSTKSSAKKVAPPSSPAEDDRVPHFWPVLPEVGIL